MWTHGAEERVVSIEILTLFIDGVNTTGILVVGDDVLRRLSQQAVLVVAASKSLRPSAPRQLQLRADESFYSAFPKHPSCFL